MPGVVVSPITDSDRIEVAGFLHNELNPRVSVDAWAGLLQPPWSDGAPNHGYLLRVDERLVGVYAAVYAERSVGTTTATFCNLAAFCVLEEHRLHSVRLVRAILKQRGLIFTDFSPSGNVVAMNDRLGFRRLDTATRLTVNLPRWRHSAVRLTTDPTRIEAVLRGRDAIVYRDHRTAPASRHLLVECRDQYAYVVFRAVSRKRLRLFATFLYVGGDRATLVDAWGMVRAHLLFHHRLLFTLAEHRLLGPIGGLGRELRNPRPKMVRGAGIEDASVDYMYSELALVDW